MNLLWSLPDPGHGISRASDTGLDVGCLKLGRHADRLHQRRMTQFWHLQREDHQCPPTPHVRQICRTRAQNTPIFSALEVLRTHVLQINIYYLHTYSLHIDTCNSLATRNSKQWMQNAYFLQDSRLQGYKNLGLHTPIPWPKLTPNDSGTWPVIVSELKDVHGEILWMFFLAQVADLFT